MMINLQENLDKQGIRTKPKGVCDVCQKPIVGQVITALGELLANCSKSYCLNETTKKYFANDIFSSNFFQQEKHLCHNVLFVDLAIKSWELKTSLNEMDLRIVKCATIFNFRRGIFLCFYRIISIQSYLDSSRDMMIKFSFYL